MMRRMRWTVHGVPRVPWKAEGVFDGVSEFKLDHHGKIYQHSVNNVIFRSEIDLKLVYLLMSSICSGKSWFKYVIAVNEDNRDPIPPHVLLVHACAKQAEY